MDKQIITFMQNVFFCEKEDDDEEVILLLLENEIKSKRKRQCIQNYFEEAVPKYLDYGKNRVYEKKLPL